MARFQTLQDWDIEDLLNELKKRSKQKAESAAELQQANIDAVKQAQDREDRRFNLENRKNIIKQGDEAQNFLEDRQLFQNLKEGTISPQEAFFYMSPNGQKTMSALLSGGSPSGKGGSGLTGSNILKSYTAYLKGNTDTTPLTFPEFKKRNFPSDSKVSPSDIWSSLADRMKIIRQDERLRDQDTAHRFNTRFPAKIIGKDEQGKDILSFSDNGKGIAKPEKPVNLINRYKTNELINNLFYPDFTRKPSNPPVDIKKPLFKKSDQIINQTPIVQPKKSLIAPPKKKKYNYNELNKIRGFF